MSSQDTTRTIAQSALRFLSGTFLSRLMGMGRDIAMAFAFGTSPSIAAFLTAFRLSHLLRRLFGEGAMQMAFIPQYEKLRAEDPSRASRFFLDLKKKLTLFLIGGIAIITLVASPFFAHSEILKLTLLMLPSLLFICLYGINASFLQCHNRFFTASAAPCLFNLIWIASIAFIYRLPPEKAMEYLAGGIILACLAQWLVTQRETKQLINKNPPAKTETSDLKSLLTPLSLGFIGVASTQINATLDTLFARFAEAEGPAYLWYAIRLQQMPLALFGIALSSALLPPLTRAIKSENLPQFCHFLRFALLRNFQLMIPTTLFLFVLGNHCVQLLFQRGSFTEASTLATAKCLQAYAFGLVPMTLILLLAPALYAFGDYRSASRGSLMAMGLNVFLNATMVFILGFGAYSIAVATSLSAWFQCYYLLKRLKKHVSFTLPSPVLTIVYTFMGVATYHFVSKYFIANPIHDYLHQLATFCCLSLAFGLFPAYHLLRTKS